MTTMRSLLCPMDELTKVVIGCQQYRAYHVGAPTRTSTRLLGTCTTYSLGCVQVCQMLHHQQAEEQYRRWMAVGCRFVGRSSC